MIGAMDIADSPDILARNPAPGGPIARPDRCGVGTLRVECLGSAIVGSRQVTREKLQMAATRGPGV